jgi:hypothetical protein
MKNKLIFSLLLVPILAACGGKSGARGAAQQSYETVEEGSAAGVTSTIQGPGETLPPITGTNADTTTAFALNPNAVPPPSQALAPPLSAPLPPPMTSASASPVPQPRPAPAPAPQPAVSEPAPATETAAAPPPATTTTQEQPKEEEPPPPADDTSGEQAEEPPPPPPPA